MITERGAGVLIGAAFAWLLGRFLGVPELYVVACAALMLVLLSIAVVWLSAARLDVQRQVLPARVAWGARARVTVTVRNRRRLPTGLLLLTDDVPFTLADGPRFVVPTLPRNGQVTLAYDLSGAGRGRYRIGPARVRLRDPFGLGERTHEVGGTAELVVYPQVLPLTAVPAAARRSDGGARRRSLLNAGDEFSTIREWAPGDDVRMVHWPSSAHRSRLMVRQFEQPYEPLATLWCDTRTAVHRGAGPDSSAETAIVAVASAAAHLSAHGHRVRLRLPGDRGPLVAQDLSDVLDRLAETGLSGETGVQEPLAAVGGRGGGGLLVAALAPPADTAAASSADVRALISAGRGYRVRIALVVEPTGRGGAQSPAAALAALLHEAGWRSVVLRRGDALADAWLRVAGQNAVTLGGAR